MPFAQTIRHSGVKGDVKYADGTWTGLPGDASGTVSVATMQVLVADYVSEDADTPKESRVATDISYSAGIATITVHNHMDVTNGKFHLEYR